MRSVAVVTIFAFLGCHEGVPVPTVDPSKVEREVRKIEAAAKAIAESLEAAREASPQPAAPADTASQPAPAEASVESIEPSVE